VAFADVGELVRKHWTESEGNPAFSSMFPEVLRVLTRHRLRFKHDYSKLFLTLVTMEGYLYSLDPAFDMLENARRKRVEHAEYASVGDEAHDLVFGEVGSYSAGRFSGAATPEDAYRGRNAFVLDTLGVGPGSFLIDVGCGRGQLLHAAKSRGARTLGVTISRAEHESCRSKGLECVLTSWEDFDLRDGDAYENADVITAIELDNHLATLHENRAGLLDLRLSRFFAWARAHLRDGGRLFLQSLAVPDALLHDERFNDDYERLSDVAPWLGFSTLPQLVRCSDPFFRLEQALDHSSDLLPTYELWRANTNRSLPQLRRLIGDESLVYLRRQLDTLIWLAERERLQLYRLVLKAKDQSA
jgi:cyclopropane fatty-acyl-phospholipid synthase-like methyltransferase